MTATLLDAGVTDLIISDNPYDCTRIGTDTVPLLVTVCKIGDYCLVDPTAEEEVCSTVSMVVSVSMRDNEGMPRFQSPKYSSNCTLLQLTSPART